MLSYDEIFKKWQKSGESKTPGGVKIGIFRFIAVLSFCISTSPLWAADLNSAFIPCRCATFNSSDSNAGSCFSSNGLLESDKSRLDAISVTGDENRCKAVAGCKYTSGCEKGNSDYYTDYTTGGQDYTPQRCPEGFPNSAAGSWSEDQCYDTTNCAGVNQHSASTSTPHTCRVYHSGKVVCKNSNTQPTCSGAWSSNTNDGICNLNQASLEGFDYNDNNLEYTYHIEGTGNNAKCYSNTRNCNLFTTENTAVSNVSGLAEWKLRNTNNQTYEWDVVNCKKQEEYNGNNCEGIEIESPSISCNTISDCHSWVQNATSDITYNNNSGYYCKSCNAGYEVNNSTDANNQTTCDTGLCSDSSSANTCDRSIQTSSQVYICKCGAINRGYYRDSVVDLCDNNNNNCKRSFSTFLGLFNGDVNQPCGPGQTTNGGATSEADCHYTTQTRFCDAHGCFYLSGLSWGATNGYTWGGATSTTSGQ